MFTGLDAVALYSLIAARNPRRYIEIGSGNSTKFARKAIRDHGLRTRILSIDPQPRAEIDALCDVVMRQPLETVDLNGFEQLGEEDMLFVDNSHRSFQNSDVTVFFTEILPRLRSGCLWGVHDVFLPCDYPESFHSFFFNEQYLLMTYLLGGAGGDTIFLPVAHCANEPSLADVLRPLSARPGLAGLPLSGGGFWMTRA
jgi:hypothetical protein